MQDEKLQTSGEEISLKDIVNFFKCNYKPIVIWGAAGLLISSAYVIRVPKKYEATWQMQMAQSSEEPAALVQRLRMPTGYSVEVPRHCEMPEDGEFGDYLGGKLEIKVTKDVAAKVDMKVRAASPMQARQCAEAIVTMIVAQQRSLIQERLAGRQEQITQYQQALVEEQEQLEKIKMSTLGNFGYLAKLDKLSWLRARIDGLQEEIFLSQMHPAKLIAPIYVPNKPVSPKVGLVVSSGVLLGLMLGVLYALVREGWRKLV